jgi:transcriptional regulator with XRE-family HTH domain
MSFAVNLERERKRAGLTQEELAEKLGVKQALISQYENGVKLPTIQLAVKIAKLFGTTCEEMVAR